MQTYLSMLDVATNLLRANPSIPVPASVRLDDSALTGPAVEVHTWTVDDLFAWALQLGCLVRVSDRGTSLKLEATQTCDGVTVVVWDYANGRDARALLDQFDWRFDENAGMWLDPATREVATPQAEVVTEAVAS